MVTKDRDILGALMRLNLMIKHRGVVVVLGKRYGYKALDLYHRQTKGGGMIDTIKSGMTSGQAVEYINAMIKGIALHTWGA